MYQIGICDDEPVFLKHISALTNEIMLSLGIPCCIHTFQNDKEVSAYLEDTNHPLPANLNLLLLDILLDNRNGIQFAKHLREEGNTLPIIFITSSIEFALEGYDAEPLGYLLKPVERSALTETLRRAYKKYTRNMLVIDTPSKTISFSLDEVLYIEIYDKTLSVHLQDGSTLEAMTNLNSLLEKLPQEQFVQCHRSYIVSLPAVSSLCRYSIRLKNHETIPVSKKRYKNVKNALLKFFTA